MRHDNRAAFEDWAERMTTLPLSADWKKIDPRHGGYANWETAAYWLGWIGGWRTAWDTKACTSCGAEGFRLTDGLCDGCTSAQIEDTCGGDKYFEHAREVMEAAEITSATHNVELTGAARHERE